MGRAYQANQKRRKAEGERQAADLDFARRTAQESVRQYARSQGDEWNEDKFADTGRRRRAPSEITAADAGSGKWTKYGWENSKSTKYIKEMRESKDLGGDFNSVSDWAGVTSYYKDKLAAHNAKDFANKDDTAPTPVEKDDTSSTQTYEGPSKQLAKANAYVSAKDEADRKGNTTQQIFGTNPVSGKKGFNGAASFMDSYKSKVKENLEPKPSVSVSSSIANAAKADNVQDKSNSNRKQPSYGINY